MARPCGGGFWSRHWDNVVSRMEGNYDIIFGFSSELSVPAETMLERGIAPAPPRLVIMFGGGRCWTPWSVELFTRALGETQHTLMAQRSLGWLHGNAQSGRGTASMRIPSTRQDGKAN